MTGHCNPILLTRTCFYRLLVLVSLICVSHVATAGDYKLKRHEIDAQGHTLVVWEKTARRAKKQILLLHGRTWSSLPDFDLQVQDEDLSFMDGLADRGFRVLALDARGYGGTARDTSGWLTPDRAAKDAAIVLAWMKADKAVDTHLFGWSYGSMVAQLVVQRDPSLVSTVTFFGYPFNPARHIVPADQPYPSKAPARPNTAENAASDFIVAGAISQQAIDAYVAAALQADPIRVDFRNLHEWAELDASKITTPSLLLQGQFDPLAPTAMQASFFSQINQGNKWWVVLPGGDHAALLETPRITMLDAIAGFINNQHLLAQ
ncbi:MAG: alpha/beta fold hydrolase [Pseudomonadales bacterium]|nr:alpha/beta fold hydrolase [Pseudomonadales bacterium]